MKILRLTIKNFLGIRAAEVDAGGDSVLITGGNARGKTSILSAVKAAFSGIEPSQIALGSDGAEINLELDEITIARALSSEGKEGFDVRTLEGVKLSKPKTYLKEIAGALNFNPVAFFFMKPIERREVLLRAMPIEVTGAEVTKALIEIRERSTVIIMM